MARNFQRSCKFSGLSYFLFCRSEKKKGNPSVTWIIKLLNKVNDLIVTSSKYFVWVLVCLVLFFLNMQHLKTIQHTDRGRTAVVEPHSNH